MQARPACLLRRLALLATALALAGCPTRPPAPPAALAGPAPHLGVPYSIDAPQSLLLIRVYKGGALAAAGHNHVIASHALSGSFYLPRELLRSSFEVHVPLAALTVDERALRARESAADFPPDVPDSAREGTRRNMLGPALLAAADYPEIVLSALSLEPLDTDAVMAHIRASVRGAAHDITVPVRYERSAAAVVASGETTLRQSDLGLKPFSAALGTLQVQDEMRISFRIVAHPAPPTPGP